MVFNTIKAVVSVTVGGENGEAWVLLERPEQGDPVYGSKQAPITSNKHLVCSLFA
jgi:hypothetical protein